MHHLCLAVSGDPQQSKGFLQFGAHRGAFRSYFLRGTGTGQLGMLHAKCVVGAAGLTLCMSSFFFFFFFFLFFPECPQSRLQIYDLYLFSLMYNCAFMSSTCSARFCRAACTLLSVWNHLEQGKRQRWVTLGWWARHSMGRVGVQGTRNGHHVLPIGEVLGNRATATATGNSTTTMR